MTIFGSARIDENGKLNNGKAGDQKQIGVDDYKGEVSMQEFYIHKKGWLVLRPKDANVADRISRCMIDACNNINIGYDQTNRLGVIKNGIYTTEKTACDCSSLVRACVKEATGKDPGNFNTASEPTMLINTGLFNPIFTYSSDMDVYVGDILVTKTKGHTGVICYGKKQPQKDVEYYPACSAYTVSIVAALQSVGETDTSISHRKRIGIANGINGVGTASANTQMLKLLKEGKLIKA